MVCPRFTPIHRFNSYSRASGPVGGAQHGALTQLAEWLNALFTFLVL